MLEACCRNEGTRLLFSCSGGSDVGELADRACRALAERGVGRMYCLSGIGGDVAAIVQTTWAADSLVAIDGCSVGCAAATLRRQGFEAFQRVIVTELGFPKGKTPVTPEVVGRIVQAVEAQAADEGERA